MLFDLRGRRRRVIQVVYAFLALAFAITFVGFGIGSDASGGIFDALGLGSGNGSGSNPAYEQRIENAEEKLEVNPKNRAALIELARTHALDGKDEITEVSETGAPVLNDEARTSFEAAASAWERYLATKPAKPDSGLAIVMVRDVYIPLNDARRAAAAQRIFAEANPSSNAYATLAQFLYIDGQFDEGDEAADLAVAEATGSTKTTLERQLAQIEKQARRFVKAQKKQAAQGSQPNPVENPFGSIGGSGITP